MTNKEIIRFANWWLGASIKSTWEKRKLEFFDTVNKLPIGVMIVFVDSDFKIVVKMIDEIPFILDNIKAVGIC